MGKAWVVKVILILILLFSTFVVSLIPMALSSLARRWETGQGGGRRGRGARCYRAFATPLLALLKCGVGGVLIGSIFLYLLPHVDHEMNDCKILNDINHNYPWAGFVIVLGMFLILFVEQIIIKFHERSDRRSFAYDMLRQSEGGGGGGVGQVGGGGGKLGRRGEGGEEEGENGGGISGVRNDKKANGDVDRNSDKISKSFLLKLSSQNVLMEKLRRARESLSLRSGLLVVALLLHEFLEGLHFGFLDKDKFEGKV